VCESSTEIERLFAVLSQRELEVVRLVVEGATNEMIAQRLGRSARTVHSHVAAAMRKTESISRTHLAVRALRGGIVPLDACCCGREPLSRISD
jgi:DNA-binding NarL/FixJ family response regulator